MLNFDKQLDLNSLSCDLDCDRLQLNFDKQLDLNQNSAIEATLVIS